VHRAKTQRRQEKQKQDLAHYRAENRFKVFSSHELEVLTGEAGTVMVSFAPLRLGAMTGF